MEKRQQRHEKFPLIKLTGKAHLLEGEKKRETDRAVGADGDQREFLTH